MPTPTVNSIYPSDYFRLPGVDQPTHPNELWWSSVERNTLDSIGLPTSEYLEVDFGRVREVNYMAFDIMRKPVNITIEYDALSSDDGTHTWAPVVPVPQELGGQFDNIISFTGDHNPWQHAEFYFTDQVGNMIATRFFRIRFQRRNADWPAGVGPWSIDVANLRTARYITNLDDTRGILTGINLSTQTHDLLAYQEIRQPFSMPQGYQRGDNGFIAPRDPVITPIIPDLVGFGFIAEINDVERASFNWSLWEVTTGVPFLLRQGLQAGANTVGKCWVDIFFDPRNPIETTPDSKYQIRIKTNNASASNLVYVANPNPLGSGVDFDLETLYQDDLGAQTVLLEDNTALTFRVWADIGESGKDVLGNFYREGVRRDEANNVLDHAIHTAWSSAPCPSPTGVECLYFDVRRIADDETLLPAIIDAIRVNPSTTGPFMHIYYSNESAQGSTPQAIEDWESLLWTPIQQTYVLDKNHTYDLPRPVRASYVCLEFTNLQPMPYPLPDIPRLPAVSYKEHPSWAKSVTVNGSFNGTQMGVPSFISNTSRVTGDAFDIYGTIAEFVIGSRNLDLDPDQAIQLFKTGLDTIDPVMLAKISFNTPQMYSRNLTTDANGATFAQYVADQAAQNGSNYPSEFIYSTTPPSIQGVSTGNRIMNSFAHVADQPVYFDRVCRHAPDLGGYAVIKASFNKKAYFVGINDVQFYRKDFTVERDDPIIHDVLADSNFLDSPLVELNTWVQEAPSRIETAQSLYITYQVNGIQYSNEVVQFEQAGEELNFNPIELSAGGGRAANIVVSSNYNSTGVLYINGSDFDIIFDAEAQTNSIVRNSLHYRLIARAPSITNDIQTVTGISSISSVDRVERITTSVVIGITILGVNELYHSGTGTEYSDSQYVQGISQIDSADLFNPPRIFTEAYTLTGFSLIDSIEVYSGRVGQDYFDSATVIAKSDLSASTERVEHSYVDAGTSIGLSRPSTTEFYIQASAMDIMEHPPLAESTLSVAPAVLRPIFFPLHPQGQKKYVSKGARTNVTSSVASAQAVFALYVYTYTGSGQFTASRIATTAPADLSSIGIAQADWLGGSITLDFTNFSYFIGIVISGTIAANLAAAPGAPGYSIVQFTSPIPSVTDLPAGFTHTSVASYGTYPYIALLTEPGEALL